MFKKIVFGAALALVIVGIAAPSASASCNPPKSASSFNVANSQYAYFVPSIANPTTVVGRIWSGAIDNTGTCNDQNFVYFSGPGIGFNLSLGDGCVVGCPAGSLKLQVTVGNALGETQTLTTAASEVASASVQFDFSAANLALGNYPRPRATSSSRVGSTVNLGIGIDSLASFAYNGTAGEITGYNIVSASGAADPGLLASAYTLRSTVAAPGGIAGTGAAAIDCSNIANDQWVALQLVTVAGPSNTVGARTRVKCNPALANPNYKVIPKKSMGSTTQK